MKAWGIFLAIVAIVALPTSADAKPGYFVSGAGQRVRLRFPGSDGYRIEVQAGRSRHAQIFVIAKKGPAEVSYAVGGSLGSDGSIDARLPHVGRIAVEFDPVHVTRHRPPDNCKGRPSVVEHGYFRGTIELHGEREFTTVDRNSVRGRFVHSFRQVCLGRRSREGTSFRGKGSPNDEPDSTFVVADRESPIVDFMAGLFGPQSKSVGPFFRASKFQFREGMVVISAISALGQPEDLILSKPGEPKVAKVTPPAPFKGSATFTLTSPKTSTWEGDLAVELPAVGQVQLAGDEFSSALCGEFHCTDTDRMGSRFGVTAITVDVSAAEQGAGG